MWAQSEGQSCKERSVSFEANGDAGTLSVSEANENPIYLEGDLLNGPALDPGRLPRLPQPLSCGCHVISRRHFRSASLAVSPPPDSVRAPYACHLLLRKSVPARASSFPARYAPPPP